MDIGKRFLWFKWDIRKDPGGLYISREAVHAGSMESWATLERSCIWKLQRRAVVGMGQARLDISRQRYVQRRYLFDLRNVMIYIGPGIWLSPSPKSLPILTLFGSTNLNSRSAHLDTELSFVMVVPSRHVNAHTLEGDTGGTETPNAPDISPTAQETSESNEEYANTALSLRQRLQYEIDNIRANSSTWKGSRRKVQLSTKLMVWFVKGML